MKSKFALNDLILFYKIINHLVPINLPEHFTIIKPEDVRLTRKTATILDDKDMTSIKCSIKPSYDSYRNCFFYRTMKLWNSVPYTFRPQSAITKLKSEVSELLLSADLDWPD